MNHLPLLIINLKAAIAVVAAHDRVLTALLVLVWGRISRIGARLERLIAQWRAGTLPKPRAPRAPGVGRASPSAAAQACPTSAGWLIDYVREAAPFAVRLEFLMGEDEFARFLAEVPQARRILRPLRRMLAVGVARAKVPAPRPVWTNPVGTPVAAPGGLVMGPGQRLVWV